jgi:acetyl esterase/lipase
MRTLVQSGNKRFCLAAPEYYILSCEIVPTTPQTTMKTIYLLLALHLAGPVLIAPVAIAEGPRKADRPRKDDKERRDEKARKEDKDRKPDELPGAYEVIVEKNLAYRTDKDADPIKHRLDLYLPKGQKDFPVVMFVHGGGWHSGNKEMYASIGRVFARNGLGAAVINYRLTPKVKHPGHIEDVAKAFVWLRGNVGRYGGRADRIIACGHSAGGHLVALLATDDRYLKAEGAGLNDIRGVIAISGAYAIDSIYGLYTSVFGADRAVRRDASPCRHVTGGHPPFLLLYAERDLPTVEKETRNFQDDLRQANCEVQANLIKNRTHISVILLAIRDEDPATQAMFDFCEAHTEWKRPLVHATPETGKP